MLVVGVAVVFRAKKRTMKQATAGTLRALTRQPHQQCLSECDAGMRQDLSNAAAGVN